MIKSSLYKRELPASLTRAEELITIGETLIKKLETFFFEMSLYTHREWTERLGIRKEECELIGEKLPEDRHLAIAQTYHYFYQQYLNVQRNIKELKENPEAADRYPPSHY